MGGAHSFPGSISLTDLVKKGSGSKYLQSDSKYVAVVAGSTGATGRRVVECLSQTPNCTKIYALSRRDIDLKTKETWIKSFPGLLDTSKLKIEVIPDYENLHLEEALENIKKDIVASSEMAAKKPISVVGFCSLGTAPWSELVDFHYSRNYVEGLVETFGTSGTTKSPTCLSGVALTSAQGANPRSKLAAFKDWVHFAGYGKCLGRREEAFHDLLKEKKVPFVIARPGPLERDEMKEGRLKEKILDLIMPKSLLIHCKVVARMQIQGIEMMMGRSATKKESGEEMINSEKEISDQGDTSGPLIMGHKEMQEQSAYY